MNCSYVLRKSTTTLTGDEIEYCPKLYTFSRDRCAGSTATKANSTPVRDDSVMAEANGDSNGKGRGKRQQQRQGQKRRRRQRRWRGDAKKVCRAQRAVPLQMQSQWQVKGKSTARAPIGRLAIPENAERYLILRALAPASTSTISCLRYWRGRILCRYVVIPNGPVLDGGMRDLLFPFGPAFALVRAYLPIGAWLF